MKTMLDKIKESGAVSEQQARLLGFLIEDVKQVVNEILTNGYLASVETPSAHFEDLDTFAQYWEHHLKTLQQ